jgi:hypothetical protein
MGAQRMERWRSWRRTPVMSSPQQPRGAQLGDLHEEVHADGPEEGQARREASTSMPAATPAARIRCRRRACRQAPGRRRAGLLHVVAGNRDGVELRHVLGRVGEDVGDDPHRGLGRVDVGVADHELLEDVVLDGPGQLVRRHALFFARDDVERQHRQHRAVHGHRHRHLVERDAVERSFACPRLNRWPRRPCRHRRRRADGRCRSRGGSPDRRRPTGPSARRRGCAVEGVGLLGGREAGILADRPGLAGIHPSGYSSAMKAVVIRTTLSPERSADGPSAPRGTAYCADALDLEPRRARTAPSRRWPPRPVGAQGAQLGDHRVVEHGDLAALDDAGVVAHGCRSLVPSCGGR